MMDFAIMQKGERMDDLISRQGVMEVLSQYPFEKVVNCISIIEEFPSAHPEHLVKESGNLVNGLVNDCISRREAIKTAKNVAYYVDEHGSAGGWLAMLVNWLEILPSAQPEHTETHECDYQRTETHDSRREWYMKGYRDGQKAQTMPDPYDDDDYGEPCNSCRFRYNDWDKEPCDGCTPGDSHYCPDTIELPWVIQRWTPVSSESMPEDGVTVWVTIKGHDVIRCEDGETLEQAVSRISKMRRVSEGFWCEYDKTWYNAGGYPMMVQPIAWMPMEVPEPYKEEQNG